MKQTEMIQKTQDKIWKILDRMSVMDEKAQRDHEKIRQNHEKAQQNHEKAQREIADFRASVAASHKELSDSVAASLAASRKDAERSRKDAEHSRKEFDHRLKELRELFTGQWGMLVESLVQGNLVKQLNKRNIKVHDIDKRVHGCILTTDSQGRKQQKKCEIDIIAQNGKEVVAVEVKTSLNTKDVDKFLGILKLFTQYWPGYKDNTVYGAVAYLRVQRGAELYAEKKGLFVIKATGDSSSIINRPSFKPKVFS